MLFIILLTVETFTSIPKHYLYIVFFTFIALDIGITYWIYSKTIDRTKLN